MKRSMFIGGVFMGVVVCILLVHNEVFTMEKGGTKQMTITVDIATGNFIKVVDDKGMEAVPVDPEEATKIYESEDGFRYVAQILHAHSSPGCWYYFIAGRLYKVCVPQP